MFKVVNKPLLNNHTKKKVRKQNFEMYVTIILHLFQRVHTWQADWAIRWATVQWKTRLEQCARTQRLFRYVQFSKQTLLNNLTKNKQSKPRILRYMWPTFYIYFKEKLTHGKQTEISNGPQTNWRLDSYYVPEPRDCLRLFNLVIKVSKGAKIRNR